MNLQNLFAVIFTLSNVKLSNSYPFGAGSCVEGPAVLGSGMSPHVVEDYGGKLIDGNYTASLNETHFLLKAKGGSFFKGFLLRLSSKQGSAAGQMQILPEYESIAKLMESTGETTGVRATCAVDVAGVTHKDSTEKKEVAVQLNLQKGMRYHLMITVVKEEHEWFYTNKTISVLEVASTPAPSPKVIQVTAAPTAVSTAAETSASTSADTSSSPTSTSTTPSPTPSSTTAGPTSTSDPSSTTAGPTSTSENLRSSDQTSKITSGSSVMKWNFFAALMTLSIIFVL
jgi:hypothetical protein